MFTHLQQADPATGGVGLAFTDRLGGVSAGSVGALNLGRTDVDAVDDVATNFERVLAEIGVPRVVATHQVHGDDVLVVDEGFLAGWGERHHLGTPGCGVPLPVADAMVTSVRGVALCIRVADCVPVLLADPDAGLVGAAHAGRVGLAAGVLPATVAALRERGATALRAWIGPHICGGCYEVPDELRAEVSAGLPGAYATTTWGTPALDLGAAAEQQLRSLGCEVTRVDPCTRTEDTLHSHRRDGAAAGRLAGLVWLA